MYDFGASWLYMRDPERGGRLTNRDVQLHHVLCIFAAVLQWQTGSFGFPLAILMTTELPNMPSHAEWVLITLATHERQVVLVRFGSGWGYPGCCLACLINAPAANQASTKSKAQSQSQ